MRILVVNAGSSSLKLSILDADDLPVAARQLEAPQSKVQDGELAGVLKDLGPVDAVGHRIVHGGRHFLGPARIDDGVVAQLNELVDLAPLHQPKSLQALQAVHHALPDAPAVACFDTAFHATLPAAAATYALPRKWRERYGLRRYGFHGLSHAYAARRAAQLLGRPLHELRIVTCHLGAGASLAAVQEGRSVDTTMGFTPLEGLVMATRSGSVDPGLILWLLQRTRIGEQEMARALEHESGLVAMAATSDMKALITSAREGNTDAQAGFDLYVHRLRAGIASMAAAMDGLDALVFTGGVGEHAPAVRTAAAAHLTFLGVQLGDRRNKAVSEDADISARGAAVRTLVVTAREDIEIAREVRHVLAVGPDPLDR